MDLLEIREDQKMEVDIHKFTVLEAKSYLDMLLQFMDVNILELVVIHGWHRGDALSQLCRHGINSDKIKRVILGLNPGRTSFILKEI